MISRTEEDSGVQLTVLPVERQMEMEKVKEMANLEEKEGEQIDSDALLWDAVGAKIGKSKKKRSRRYFLQQKDQFSITDELGRSRSADSTDGVVHLAPIGTYSFSPSLPFLHFLFNSPAHHFIRNESLLYSR